MAITAAGVGSGLDIEGIVSQLMNIERQPLVALQRRESDYQAQLSAFGQIKSALSSFQDAMADLSTLDKFKVFSNTSSDESVLTATSDSNAAAGLYSIDVTRLAQNHKMGSGEFADTTTFGGTAGDSLTLTVGTGSISVDLSTAQTLSEVRDAINADTNNPGVTATILNTGGGNQRLVLTANDSGYDQRVQLSYGGSITAGTFNFATTNTDDMGATLVDLTQLDAAYSVDGFALTSASNNVSGVIDGITLQLKAVGSADLTLSRDTASITASAQAFVEAYNKLQGTLNGLGKDALSGDSVIRGIESQLRGVLNTAPVGLTGTFDALSQVGITTDATDGSLIFKESDFTAALDTDFASVSELFAHNDQGVAFRFDALATSLQADNGLITSREDGINSQISGLEQDQLDLEARLELKEKALRAQYAALDGLLGQLNSTSQFLAQQLNNF